MLCILFLPPLHESQLNLSNLFTDGPGQPGSYPMDSKSWFVTLGRGVIHTWVRNPPADVGCDAFLKTPLVARVLVFSNRG